MSTETPKAVPFLSDERIAGGPARVADRSDRGFVIERPNPPMGPRMVRDLYEAELQRLRGLLDEARGEADDLAHLLRGTYAEGSLTDQYMQRLLSKLKKSTP